MHPSSPHAPARLKTISPTGRVKPVGGRKATTAKGRMTTASDPLSALAKEIHGKLVPGTAAAKAHVAAEELTLRRPRRPSAKRASFRTPPMSR